MSIRKKLMILLLAITLIPLIGVIAMYEFSIYRVGDSVSHQIRLTLDENASLNMHRDLIKFEKILRANIVLLQSILQLQANELEKTLLKPVLSMKSLDGISYGRDESIKEPSVSPGKYQKSHSDGSMRSLSVSFQQQDFFIPQGLDLKKVRLDLMRLSQMTGEYYRLYQKNSDLILWQHTTLVNGLHTSYPSGAIFPENFDPRRREWYVEAKKSGALYYSNPYIDALTGKPVITISVPVRSSDGTILAITALDFSLSDVFQWLDLNPNWSNNAEGMLIVKDSTQQYDNMIILAQMKYDTPQYQWDEPLGFEYLGSEDTLTFAALKTDLLNGRSGIRRMPYKGEDALWVYQGFEDRRVYPLLIIPYENLIVLADDTEDYILRKSLEWLEYTVIIVIIVVLASIVVAIRRANAVSKPIHDLAQASARLGEGDYESRVDIRTGDELERLGEVFNEIGPRLKEHEKMQQSLLLAKEIQQRLLPQSAPHIENFDIAGLCRYSDETGGDYYDFISLDEIAPNKVSIVLGDVTGHGIGAALLMASARSMLRNNVRHYAYDLSKIMYELNNELTQDTDPGKFITLFFGVLDGGDRSLFWSLGGHDPAILLRKASDQVEELTSVGVPVGFIKDMNFEQAGPVHLKQGDIMIIGTDGIWEAENDKEEMYGKDRLIQTIIKNNEKSAIEICQKIVDQVIEFCKPRTPADDVTVVIVKAL